MSRTDPSFPWRVIALSALLFGVVAVGGWMIFGSTAADDATNAAGGGGGEAPVVDAGSMPDEPTVTEPSPQDAGANPAALVADPDDPAALSIRRSDTGTMDLQLCLIIPGVERLIPIVRTVAAPPTIDAQVRRAVEELIGWTGADTLSPVPPESRLREVWVSRGGIAYIDFDRSFYDFSGGGSLGELHTVYGVVATVTMSFPEIRAVQFLIEGETKETLSGHVDLSRPLLPSADWVLMEPRDAGGPGAGGARDNAPGVGG